MADHAEAPPRTVEPTVAPATPMADAIGQRRDGGAATAASTPRAARLAEHAALMATATRRRANRTGLPDAMKARAEGLTGLSMDDVRVHPRSAEPARYGALAFARGPEIHLGPGQERHLPHELGHVIQQKRGGVPATVQFRGGQPGNADPALERGADRLGQAIEGFKLGAAPVALNTRNTPGGLIQCALPPYKFDTRNWYQATADTKKEVYNGQERLGNSSFSQNFREQMLSVFESKSWAKQAKDGLEVRSAQSGLWGPAEGMQLDHIRSVDQIASDLTMRANAIASAHLIPTEDWEKECYIPKVYDNTNTATQQIWPESKRAKASFLTKFEKGKVNVFPALYAARMYFHDVPNLQPLLSSENASKGAASGSGAAAGAAVGQLQLEGSIMVAARDLTGKVQSLYGKPINAELAAELDELKAALNKVDLAKPVDEDNCVIM